MTHDFEETLAAGPERQSLHSLLVERLRQMIVRGDLSIGAKVPEARLCERFDVSRRPLREALKMLSAGELIQPPEQSPT